MEYRIGQVARMLGISPETIRYYDKMGVLSAERKKANNYRTYNTGDIILLTQARMYIQSGISIEKTAELLYNSSPGLILEELSAAAIKIESELLEKEKILKGLQLWMDQIGNVMGSGGKAGILNSPGMYFIACHRNGRILMEPERLAIKTGWVKLQPPAFSAVIINQKNGGYEGGLALREEDARKNNVHESPLVQYRPPRLCLRWVGRFKDTEKAEHLREIYEYMERAGLEQRGDILVTIPIKYREDDGTLYYTETLIPI